MTSDEGQDILSWAEFDAISDHIASLELLRQFKGRGFLLSHGCTLPDEQIQQEAIDNRIKYFRNILDGGGAFSYAEAARGCTCKFLRQEWLVRKGEVLYRPRGTGVQLVVLPKADEGGNCR